MTEEQTYEDQISEDTYDTKRRSEYPSVVDQLDSIYHNGVEGWKAEIKAIKDRHPKPK